MKSNVKLKIIILTTLGIFFALLPIISVNLSYIAGNNAKSSEYRDDINFDKEYLKISAISGKIHIINNSGWVDFKNAGNCTGNGTYSDPYVIEDLIIDGGSSGSCILIENSDVYFRIENCTVYNSEGYHTAGIRMNNADNGFLIDNNCSTNQFGIRLYFSDNYTISGNSADNNNGDGIYLSECNNNTVLGNIVNNNEDFGICLSDCNNNTVSGNTANSNRIFLVASNNNTVSGNTANNGQVGIDLFHSDYNTVSGNTANNHGWKGINLYNSDYNTISGNTANNNGNGIYLADSNYNTVSGNTFLRNDECIVEVDCEGNIFENNDCGIIPGYNLFFLLGTLSVAVILINNKLKKS